MEFERPECEPYCGRRTHRGDTDSAAALPDDGVHPRGRKFPKTDSVLPGCGPWARASSDSAESTRSPLEGSGLGGQRKKGLAFIQRYRVLAGTPRPATGTPEEHCNCRKSGSRSRGVVVARWLLFPGEENPDERRFVHPASAEDFAFTAFRTRKTCSQQQRFIT